MIVTLSAVVNLVFGWAVFGYLVRRAWPGIRGDFARVAGWVGYVRPRHGGRQVPASGAAAPEPADPCSDGYPDRTSSRLVIPALVSRPRGGLHAAPDADGPLDRSGHAHDLAVIVLGEG